MAGHRATSRRRLGMPTRKGLSRVLPRCSILEWSEHCQKIKRKRRKGRGRTVIQRGRAQVKSGNIACSTDGFDLGLNAQSSWCKSHNEREGPRKPGQDCNPSRGLPKVVREEGQWIVRRRPEGVEPGHSEAPSSHQPPGGLNERSAGTDAQRSSHKEGECGAEGGGTRLRVHSHYSAPSIACGAFVLQRGIECVVTCREAHRRKPSERNLEQCENMARERRGRVCCCLHVNGRRMCNSLKLEAACRYAYAFEAVYCVEYKSY